MQINIILSTMGRYFSFTSLSTSQRFEIFKNAGLFGLLIPSFGILDAKTLSLPFVLF